MIFSWAQKCFGHFIKSFCKTATNENDSFVSSSFSTEHGDMDQVEIDSRLCFVLFCFVSLKKFFMQKIWPNQKQAPKRYYKIQKGEQNMIEAQ